MERRSACSPAFPRPRRGSRWLGRLRGRNVAGTLPRRALALLAEWAALHRDELLANWERARRDEPVGDVDFRGRDWRGVFEPLRDPDFFERVTVDPEAGTINWPGGLDVAPEPLYEEAWSHPVHPAAASR
jgi:Protein of unknown function (DUF2442)/Domain of unknown function (DUF4160)